YTPFITGNIWVYDHVNKINKLRRGHVDDIGLKIQYDLGVAPWVNLSFASKGWLFGALMQPEVEFKSRWGWNIEFVPTFKPMDDFSIYIINLFEIIDNPVATPQFQNTLKYNFEIKIGFMYNFNIVY
ncbi:MAG: hypothetical protein ACRC0X_06830, partial [Brevinema sp.]